MTHKILSSHTDPETGYWIEHIQGVWERWWIAKEANSHAAVFAAGSDEAHAIENLKKRLESLTCQTT